MALRDTREDTPIYRSIKDAIKRVGTEEDGAAVEAALTDATHATGHSRDTVEAEFTEMKKRGEVYVVPTEDGEDRVKVTP